VPSNPRLAAKWFLRAAEQGHATAAHNVAACYAKGTGVERDSVKAIKWYSQAAGKGLMASQVQLGKLLYTVDADCGRDRNLAVELLNKAAEAGDTEAQVALAIVYLKGEDTAQDRPRAEALLRQAAQSGHAGAAVQLGHLCSGKYGASTEAINLKEANAWYTKAAQAGDAEAQYALGMLHLNSNVAAADSAEAVSWIERAANNDHPASLFQLGVMYGTGTAVRRDAQRALQWYELAAQLGHPLAQYNLAVMLAKGEGCEPDRDQAQTWFRKAAERGLPSAEAALRGMNGADGASASSSRRAAGHLQKHDAATTNAPAVPARSR
jgi:uncharacterized protein